MGASVVALLRRTRERSIAAPEMIKMVQMLKLSQEGETLNGVPGRNSEIEIRMIIKEWTAYCSSGFICLAVVKLYTYTTRLNASELSHGA